MKINGNPDGGGGKSAVIESLSVTSNGTYTAGGGVDGYSPVEVSVPAPVFVTESLNVSVNNTYYPGQGVDGFSQVVVNVPQSVTGYTLDQVIEGNLGVTVLSTSVSVFKTTGCWGDVTEVNLPNVKELGSFTFLNCSNLSTVNLSKCKSIGAQAFSNCTSLISISIPEVSFIDDNAFIGCYSLSSISLPKCTWINNNVFQNTGLNEIYCPELVHIQDYVFYYGSLLSFSAPNCTYIGNGTFNGCSYLSKVYIPMCGYTQWGAFEGCSSLSELTIATETYKFPYYQNTLEGTAFTNLGVGTIYVGKDKYDKFISEEGWSQFSSLFVSIGESTPMLSITSEGLLYGRTKNIGTDFLDVLSIVKEDVKAVDLPNCKIVDNMTFYNCTSLSSVSLPTCESIVYNAFGYCNNITSIYLPECMYIDSYVFQGCTSLSECNFPKCSYIGQEAFNNCPISVMTLGYSGVCENHANYYYLSSIYVPTSLVNAYKESPYWSIYSDFIFPISE